MSDPFTKDELWMIRAGVEFLHDEHKRYPQRFPEEVRKKSLFLMIKLWKITDELLK